MPRNVALLGSTGSIGRQTLDIVRSLPEFVTIHGLAAHRNTALLSEQIQEFRPRVVVSTEPLAGPEGGVEALRGVDGMVELVTRPEVDLVVVGTAGAAGLLPSLAALKAGKLVALANKEVLVMAGSVIKTEIENGYGELVPIDSEHSAIWQCLQGEPTGAIERLTLTASGGALRDLSHHELQHVTPEQALQHPTWRMGPKITIDSANLMNKGLEVLEAGWLFDINIDKIEVVLHPQSIVHSLVTFRDGSTKAQLGLPDMRLPIQYALSHPARWPSALPRLDLATAGQLTFASIDGDRYPMLRTAVTVGLAGGTYPAVLCAADEVAVEGFLHERIGFTDIPAVTQRVLDRHQSCPTPSIGDILEAGEWARAYAERLVIR